jgi:hypothetical protein
MCINLTVISSLSNDNVLIQDEVHDSIEDAKTALRLYRHYEMVCSMGPDHLQVILQDLYAYGARTNWTIGFDKLQG